MAQRKTIVHSTADIDSNKLCLAAVFRQLECGVSLSSSVKDNLLSSFDSEYEFWELVDAELVSFLCLSNLEGMPDEAIRKVSTLLESADCFRERIWLLRSDVYDRLLLSVDSFFDYREVTSALHFDRLHLAVRTILKMEQHLFNRWQMERVEKPSRIPPSHHQILSERIRNTLLKVVGHADCPNDSAFLAGTALAFHVNSRGEPHDGAQLVAFIVSTFEGGVEIAIDNLTLDPCSKSQSTAWCKCLLPVLYGLMVCGKSGVLLERPFPDSKEILALEVFHLIVKACKSSEYQTFQTLVAWFHWMKDNIVNLHRRKALDELIFSVGSPVVTATVVLLDLGASSPVTGVPEMIWDICSLLLEAHTQEGQTVSDGCSCLIQHLLNETMKLTWMVKGLKYPMLAALVPKVGISELLERFPQFLEGLCCSLASNQLASAGNAIYKSLLVDFLSTQRKLSKEQLLSLWKAVFFPSLTASLQSPDGITFHNAIRYWLATTVKLFPCTFHHLVQHLSCYSSGNGVGGLKAFGAMFPLLRLSRTTGITTFDAIDKTIINKGLCHSDDVIRAEALAIVCFSQKKAESVTMLEMEVLKGFLPLNLNVDNAAFRQRLLGHLKFLFVRLRDSCLSSLKVVSRTKDLAASSLVCSEEDILNRSRGLEAVTSAAIRALVSIGSSSRCFLLYEVTTDGRAVFHVELHFRSARCTELMQFFREHGDFRLFSDRSFRLLLLCTLDCMEEIQDMAASILGDYFLRHVGQERTAWALHLCSSPKTMHGQSGARLCAMIFMGLSCCEQVQMTKLVLRKLQDQLAVARADMLVASRSAPMHGTILALRHMICSGSDFWTANIAESRRLLEQCLHLCECVIHHVLGVLAAKSSSVSDVAPSFEEMGRAIDGIVSLSSVADVSSPSVSVEHQLILSCCWLSLKESCLLLGSWVNCLPLDDGASEKYCLGLDQVNRSGVIICTVLTTCRHRGAIEACSLGLELFCRRLLEGGQPSLVGVVDSLLHGALTRLQSCVVSSSVTRRSAGLPLLLVAIVRHDRRPSKPFVAKLVNFLLEVAEHPMGVGPIDDAVDVLQANAFHILKALVNDATLSQEILFHIGHITVTCLNGFYSTSWAVRNAALQLFGSLAPRLVGQKKVSDDNSGHNGLTFTGFFARWHELQGAFESHLTRIDDCSLRPAVVPILSLLGCLSPDVSEQSDSYPGKKIEELVQPFVGCHIWNVRHTAARFLARSCPRDRCSHSFLNLSSSLPVLVGKTNQCHGHLLTMLNLMTRLEQPVSNPVFEEQMRNAFDSVLSFLNLDSLCPIIHVTILDMYRAAPVWLRPRYSHLFWEVLNRKCRESSSNWKPGYSLWLKAVVHRWLYELPLQELAVKMPNRDSLAEEVLAYTLVLLERLEDLPTFHCTSIQKGLLSFCEATTSSTLLLSCFELMVNTYIQKGVGFGRENSGRVLNLSKSILNGTHVGVLSAVALALWAIVISEYPCPDNSFPLLWLHHLNRCCNPRMSEDVRVWAAKALVICGAVVLSAIPKSEHQPSNTHPPVEEGCAVRILQASLSLLQDEHADVRWHAAKFVLSLDSDKYVVEVTDVQPNVAIQMLCNYYLKYFYWSSKLRDYLWTNIESSLINYSTLDLLISSKYDSLFGQEDVNVYAERVFTRVMYGGMLKRLLLHLDPQPAKDWVAERADEVKMRALQTKHWLSTHKDPYGTDDIEVYCQPKVAIHLAEVCAQMDLLHQHMPSDVISDTYNEFQTWMGAR